MEALDRSHRLALEDEAVSHRLHAQDTDAFAHQRRQHVLAETAEVGIHDIERHLYRVEVELVLSRHLQHPQVDERVLVAGESDEADLARLLRLDDGFLSAALGEVSISAGRTQSFLGAKYRRLARRMPKKKALVATGNSALTIIHALLSDPAARYTDLGPDYYEQRMHARRQARNHVRSLERLGYKVTIEALNPDTSQPLTATA